MCVLCHELCISLLNKYLDSTYDSQGPGRQSPGSHNFVGPLIKKDAIKNKKQE
jgi:hypothetical protein